MSLKTNLTSGKKKILALTLLGVICAAQIAMGKNLTSNSIK
jgi:hypothetical protein